MLGDQDSQKNTFLKDCLLKDASELLRHAAKRTVIEAEVDDDQQMEKIVNAPITGQPGRSKFHIF